MNRSTVALILEVAALVMLSLALLDVAWLDARAMPRLAVLVDRSFSMPRPAVDAALRALTRSVKSAGAAEVEVLEFAGRPASARDESTDSLSAVQSSATNIERALDAALAAHARSAYAGALVISDGFETEGETVRALQAAREARLPIHWLAMGRAPPDARIVNVLAP